jgi:hypothetical protein
MGMRHPDRPCMKSNMCGTDRRTSDQIASDPWDRGNLNVHGGTLMPNAAQSPDQVSTSPSGGEVAKLNARIAELEAKNAKLLAQQGAPADPTKMVRQGDERIRHLTKSLRDTMSREKFRSQLSVIQHYAPIEGEANIIACPKCS